MKRAPKRLSRVCFAMIGALVVFMAVGFTGCQSPLTQSSGIPFLLSSSEREIEKAAANDPFPTAAQAGIPMVKPAK